MAIRHAPRRPIELDEFLSMPETEPASELVDGEVVQKPMGKVPHSRAQSRLLTLLMVHEATRDGEALVEQGINGPGANHRVPDVAWFAPGRLEGEEDYPDFAPDLAVEVRSEGQSLAFLRGKLNFLREHGSVATMLVDPRRKVIEVVDGDIATVATESDTVVLRSIGGFSFAAARLFK